MYKRQDNESDLEGNFKAWVYDVICEANIRESIHYVTSPENYREIPVSYTHLDVYKRQVLEVITGEKALV